MRVSTELLCRLLSTINKIPRLVRNGALFFIITIIIFGLFEPGLYLKLTNLNKRKDSNLAYALPPSQSQKPSSVSTMSEQPVNSLDSYKVDNPKVHKYEDVSKRTANSSTYVNNDGTKTLEWNPVQQNYKDETSGKWEKIDTKIHDDSNVVSSSTGTSSSDLSKITSLPSGNNNFTAKAGNIKASIKDLYNGISFSAGGKTFTITPKNGNNAVPQYQDDGSIIYQNAWKNTDLVYEIRGESIKETIVIKDKDAPITFNFEVSGGKVINHPDGKGKLTIEGLPKEYSFSELTMDVNKKGVISENVVSQGTNGNNIEIKVDKKWFDAQPTSSFPMKIDPPFAKQLEIQYMMYKSDGYSCSAAVCYANTGTLYDGGWKTWRTEIYFPYSELTGKTILDANLHGFYKSGIGGDTVTRWMALSNASCWGYNCLGALAGSATASTDFDINFTQAMKNVITNGLVGAAWEVTGEEGAYTSYKPYFDMRVNINYYTPAPMATAISPVSSQVVVDTQPTLKVNPIGDIDGDKVKYFFRVSTNSNAESGAVINSDWIESPQWTIPDGILQDGVTYYWHVYTYSYSMTYLTFPTWVNSFKIDLRTGKDSTQSYENVGPVGVDIATGNTTLDTSTHSMSALGGSIGLNLNYNTPNKSKKGLLGEYWNVSSGYNFANGAPTFPSSMTRRDQNIDFAWMSGNPGGSINSDLFYAKWTGQFVAPVSGSYQFGAQNDDNMRINVNNQEVYNTSISSGISYGNSITLEAGQAVPIRVDYLESFGDATAKVYVRGPVSEQTLSRDWLFTDAVNQPSSYGLNGRYYTDNSNAHDLDVAAADPSRLMMARQDTKMNLMFGSGGAASGLQTDNFMARWTGYVTVPSNGSYTFGAETDDGIRIKLNNGAWQTVMDRWQDQAGVFWGNAITLQAGTQIPITVDWFEHGGGATMSLKVRGDSYAEQEIPVTWLTPQAKALPSQWNLGVDIDGNVSYEKLRVSSNSVILEDSTRSTHEYTYSTGGYKPPIGEDGFLTKNADNSYTLIDSDGRTYIFSASGVLTSVTTPSDDRQPAALKYTYDGDPSRLVKIEDGVTSTRYGLLHYKGSHEDNMCVHPSGFSDAPSGMLCAFETSDGNITHFYYDLYGNLTRTELPGNQITDYVYNPLGQIISVRSSLAADAIAAGQRADDSTVRTELSYDSLGRIKSVKAPAANTGSSRIENTFDYGVGSVKMHVTGASEPNGFSKKVEYDDLLRTIKQTDLTGNSTQTEWDHVKDLQLSTTDAIGLKSTIIYDGDDRAIDSYGPAPSSWFGSDRKPTAGYVSQVPHTSSNYDEGINGPAVSYMAVKQRTSSVMPNGMTFARGQSITSTDGRFGFVYQTDGNVVLYGPGGSVLWNLAKAGVASDRFVMQTDGNLVLYNGATPIWWTGTSGGNSSYLKIQNNGDLQIISAAGVVWQTMTGSPYTTPSDNPTSLTGTPLLNTTNLIANSAQISNNWSTSPISSGSNYWGVRMTGKMYLPTTGNWNFRIVSDNGVRMTIDDNLIINDWSDGNSRSHPSYIYNNVAGATTPHRIMIDYYHLGGSTANFTLYMTPAGGTETANVAQYIKPGYNLTTSQTAYDAQLGNVTSTTNYAKPEYGLATTTTADPSGLNLQATATFETPGSGFLRQTGRTLPGGTSTSYNYYGANDSVDNPCTVENDPAVQAGAIKGKTETDPDGSGPKQSRTTETVYNASGKVVATRFNGDPWTCVSYDSRGRQTSSVQPTVNGRPGRTMSNQYAADGNPLKNRMIDSVAGTTETVFDILGRTVSTKDVWGNDYALTYDNYGNVAQKTGPLGTETYTYDTLFRPTSYALDSTIFATVAYDNFGRVATVTYPESKDTSNNTLKLTQVKRDNLGRSTGIVYQTSDGKTFDESVVRSQLGKIMSATQVYDSQTLNSNFVYDTVGRLTSGTVGQTKFDYGYNAPDTTTCNANSANNAQSNKNSNRTSYKITNNVTNAVVTDDRLCYNYADQLTYSTDIHIGTPAYDDHGNTTSFSGNGTPLTFGYDANDNNISVTQGTKRTEYVKAATGGVLRKKEFDSGQLVSSYRYVAGGVILQTCSLTDDNNCTTVDRYLTLPGNISLTLSPTNPDTTKRVVYSLHNYHGDTALTLTNEGKTTANTNTLLAYGPFGEQLIAGTQGTTTVNILNATDNTMGWAADPARKQEGGYTTSFIQMGARVYIPSLGRFLQVDSVDGGTLNGYVYVADPINASDYNGKWGFGDIFSAIVNVVKAVIKAIVTPIAAVVKAVISYASPPKAAASSGGGRPGGSAPAASSGGGRAGGSMASANLTRPITIPGPGGTDIFDIKNTTPKTFKSGPSFDLKSLIPPAGYSWGGLGTTVGGGCTATGLLFMGIAGLPGAPVTAGVSIPAAAGAGCASGAIGGLVTYLLIGDANVQDTGIVGDAYGELMNRYR